MLITEFGVDSYHAGVSTAQGEREQADWNIVRAFISHVTPRMPSKKFRDTVLFAAELLSSNTVMDGSSAMEEVFQFKVSFRCSEIIGRNLSFGWRKSIPRWICE